MSEAPPRIFMLPTLLQGFDKRMSDAQAEYRLADTVVDKAVAEKMAEALRGASIALRVDHWSGEPHPHRAEVLEALAAYKEETNHGR